MRAITVTAKLSIEPTFRSPGEAIENATRVNSLKVNETFADALNRAAIIAVSYGDGRLEMETDKGVVRIGLDRFKLLFTLSKKTGPMPASDPERDLLLQFSEPDPVVWNRAKLLEVRMGRAISKVVFGPNSIYLYVDSEPILLVMALGRKTEQGTFVPFLYWDETD